MALLTIAGCGSSSTPSRGDGSGPPSPSTSAPRSAHASDPAGRTAVQATGVSATGVSAAGVSAATAARQPCELVSAHLLNTTLGADVGQGIFEPATAAGAGCRFTRVGTGTSVNILIETTTDAANYLPELAYAPPAGSSSVPGADRGYVNPPAAGGNNSSILLVKGTAGVLVTIFQDSPPITVANEQKLAVAILAEL